MRFAAPGLARTGVTASLQVPGSGPRVVQDSLAVTRLHYGVPRGGASCKSTANFAGERGAEVLDLDEFRRGVGLCVFNNAGQVFAARRIDDTQATWQMPQGGIDPLENPLQAALRELHEETGITSVSIVASIDRWLDYEFPTKVRAQLGGPWVRYRGQTQKWLLLRFDGADAEVDLQRHAPAEFSEWRWMALEELPRSVVGFKRGVYESVARHFCPRIARIRAGGPDRP